jgi:signal transduction histidine kinase
VLNILETYQELAASRGVSLHSDLPEDSSCVQGDQYSVAVLIDNLIVNAIHYNKPDGTVTVSACTEGSEVVVAVADTGIGIPDEYKPALFDEFFRVKGEDTKGTSGTGLGLPICRKIAVEMGGRIDVESEVGVGSTFRVRLPACRREPEESTK